MSESDETESWPHEPDLPEEPETGWPDEPDEVDPESFGPSIPSAPDPEEVENPAAVQLFWKLVVVFNFALLALAVGPMFIVFQGQWDLGLQIFFVGVLAFSYGSYRYYSFRQSPDEHNG